MKKLWILFLSFILTSCDWRATHGCSKSVFISNYHKNVYVYSFSIEKMKHYQHIKFLEPKQNYVCCGEVGVYCKGVNEYISFFQDADMQCYLFSVSNKDLAYDLIKLYPTARILIEKDGVRVVSEKEYERLKPAFKSHPFDPTLCKPKPVEMN